MTSNDTPDPQDWWHEEPEDPHQGLTLLSMAIALFILLPLHERWIALRASASPREPS